MLALDDLLLDIVAAFVLSEFLVSEAIEDFAITFRTGSRIVGTVFSSWP